MIQMTRCMTCGDVDNHTQDQADLAVAHKTRFMLASSGLEEEAEALERIIEGWRGHALPECSPVAIS